MQHASDCATNNGPALPPGECDCGGAIPEAVKTTICAFCGYAIRDAYVEAASGVYCLGHEPSARPDQNDQIIADLLHGKASK